MPQQRKSESLHRLHGTVSQAKPDKPSYVMASRPKFPKHLSRVGKQEYKRCVQILEERGTATAGDYAVLSVYVEVYARWVQAKEAVGQELMVTTTITDNNGTARTVTRLNPLLKVVQACESRMLGLIKELGLTPAARDKVKPTAANRELEVVPGSMADLMPELLKGTK
jgi:P27 family predicted phage terminase small subunit